MDRLKKLPEITDLILRNVQADDQLKQRILEKALASSGNSASFRFRRPLGALVATAGCMIAVIGLLAGIRSLQPVGSSTVTTISAGSVRSESPVRMKTVISEITDTSDEGEDAEQTSSPPASEQNSASETPLFDISQSDNP